MLFQAAAFICTTSSILILNLILLLCKKSNTTKATKTESDLTIRSTDDMNSNKQSECYSPMPKISMSFTNIDGEPSIDDLYRRLELSTSSSVNLLSARSEDLFSKSEPNLVN